MPDSPNTIRLHRVLRAPAERIYKAFLDPDALARWWPPFGIIGKVIEMDARVGGGHRMSFTNFATGSAQFFTSKYIELTPGKVIRYTTKFDDPGLPGEMAFTITLREVSCGTEISIVQEGIPDVIPAEMCCLGWQEGLLQLSNLVEPEIPGA